MDRMPRVSVAGDAFERGVQYGEQARSRVHASIAAYLIGRWLVEA